MAKLPWEALIKACFPILDSCWPGMRPQRRNIVADGLGWLASFRWVEGSGRSFSPPRQA
jgi:hypothetical protein